MTPLRHLSAWLALVLSVGALTVAGSAVSTAGAQSARADRDCGDFRNQAAAQSFYVANGGPGRDPHRLDADGDGVACETLPCPCSSSTGGGAGTPTTSAKTRVVKVINGELVRVRKGRQSPYVVHLLGVKVPKRSCESRAATRDLRSWVKPGMVVKVVDGKKSRKRDKAGYRYRYLIRAKGSYDIGGSQIATGFAGVDRALRFGAKKRYLRWEKKAVNQELGYHGSC